MAKTEKIVLEGTAEWSKVFSDNRDMEGFEGAYKEHGGAYTINVILDTDNYGKLRDTKTMKKGTVHEDGMNVKFIRKHDMKFVMKDGTEIDNGGAPQVFGPDGKEWSFEENGHIGNGSKVKVGLSVYGTSRKTIFGTRLEWVKVVELVEMNPQGDFTPDTDDEVPF